MRQALESRLGARTLADQEISADDHVRVERAGRRYAALPVRAADAVSSEDGLEVAPSEVRLLEQMLHAGRVAVALHEEASAGLVIHSMYHCRPDALKLCRRLVQSIDLAKRHAALYGDVQATQAAAADKDILVQLSEEPGPGWVGRARAKVAAWVLATSKDLSELSNGLWERVTLGTGPGLRYAGPNVGRLQYALLRLITVFELDEKDVFTAGEADATPAAPPRTPAAPRHAQLPHDRASPHPAPPTIPPCPGDPHLPPQERPSGRPRARAPRAPPARQRAYAHAATPPPPSPPRQRCWPASARRSGR